MTNQTLEKRQKKLKAYYEQLTKEQANKKQEILSKKEYRKHYRYLDKLFLRIFLSSFLLLTVLLVCKNAKINHAITNMYESHFNFSHIANRFSKQFSGIIDPIGDKTVYSKNVYDSVTYDNGINKVKNYHFNGVTVLSDGVIIKIMKDQSNRYNVTVQASDGYLYTYMGLESIDYSIYRYVDQDTILGLATYNQSYDAYLFELIIEKEGRTYDFFENAED